MPQFRSPRAPAGCRFILRLRKSVQYTLILAAGLAAGCTATQTDSTASPASPGSDGSGLLTYDNLMNLTYRVEVLPQGATLVNGMYVRREGRLRQELELLRTPSEPGGEADRPLVGDLNGDGRDEAVVLLRSWTGGTGQFHDLVIVGNGGGDRSPPEQLAAAVLGDRVRVEAMRLVDGQDGPAIHLDMIVHGPNDPMCCPSYRAARTYVMRSTGQGHEIALVGDSIVERTQTGDPAGRQ